MRVALAAVILMACGPRLYEPRDAKRLEPVPPVYTQWAGEVADCAHVADRSTDGGLSWWIVPDSTHTDFLCRSDGLRCLGFWVEHTARDRAIYLAPGQTDNPNTVKHELLHDLTHGATDHPQPPFGTCAPL